MTNLQMKKQLEKHMKDLAKTRDALREIAEEASEMDDIISEAMDSLEYACDRLSEIV